MTTHRLTLAARVPAGSGPRDVLAAALSTAETLTIVDKADAQWVGAGHVVVNLTITYRALNDNEAQATAREVRRALNSYAIAVDSVHVSAG